MDFCINSFTLGSTELFMLGNGCPESDLACNTEADAGIIKSADVRESKS